LKRVRLDTAACSASMFRHPMMVMSSHMSFAHAPDLLCRSSCKTSALDASPPPARRHAPPTSYAFE
jgi:hypothetical protein